MSFLSYRLKLLRKCGINYLLWMMYCGTIIKLTNAMTFSKFKQNFGDFNFGNSFNSHFIQGLDNFSGCIVGPVVYFLNKINNKNKKVLLLAGEDNKVKKIYSDKFEFCKVITTGLSDDVDIKWDFENDFPRKEVKVADVIVSQAMLEHLIDPYKHASDLVKLLKPKGILIFQTVLPGFGYHRVPIDCFRIYPDWFEELAKRQKLTIINKSIYNSQICYMFRK